jgi:hypothetical protein
MKDYFVQIDSTNPFCPEGSDEQDLEILKGLKAEIETLVGFHLSMMHPEIY